MVTNSVTIGFIVIFAVQAVGTVAYLTFIAHLLGRLRSSYAETWEALGSPSLLFNNSLTNNRLVLGWLWRRDYLDLREPQIIRLAGIVRGLLLYLLGNFAVLMLLFVLFGSLTSGKR